MGDIIVDADIFIDMLRGHEPAREFLGVERPQIALSVVTVTELLAGFKSAREEKIILDTVSYFRKLPVTEDIATHAGYLRHRYGKSDGAGIIDCIVAATALAEGAAVATLNRKHYPMLKNILVPYKKH